MVEDNFLEKQDMDERFEGHGGGCRLHLDRVRAITLPSSEQLKNVLGLSSVTIRFVMSE